MCEADLPHNANRQDLPYKLSLLAVAGAIQLPATTLSEAENDLAYYQLIASFTDLMISRAEERVAALQGEVPADEYFIPPLSLRLHGIVDNDRYQARDVKRHAVYSRFREQLGQLVGIESDDTYASGNIAARMVNGKSLPKPLFTLHPGEGITFAGIQANSKSGQSAIKAMQSSPVNTVILELFEELASGQTIDVSTLASE